MRVQAQEGLAHAMRLFDSVLRRGGQVELRGIEAPATDFGAPLSLFESVLEHERAVTGMIHGLFELSGKAGDWAAQQELQWFIAEQVEGEGNASTAVNQVRMAGEDQAALPMLDQQSGSRAAVPGDA